MKYAVMEGTRGPAATATRARKVENNCGIAVVDATGLSGKRRGGGEKTRGEGMTRTKKRREGEKRKSKREMDGTTSRDEKGEIRGTTRRGRKELRETRWRGCTERVMVIAGEYTTAPPKELSRVRGREEASREAEGVRGSVY